jgi:Helix-turn-helix domain
MKKKPYDPSKGRQKDALRTRLIAYRAAGGISPLELTTAIVLLDIRNTQKGDCFVHYSTIAGRVGVSIRTAFRYVEKLAQIGLFSIIPPSGNRTCSTFDFDIHWAPPAPEEAALPPVAARVADYDSRFPGRGSRVVAKALDVGQTSVVRARKSGEPSAISVQMRGSSSNGIFLPIEVKNTQM